MAKNSRLSRIYNHMKMRCYNPNNHNYVNYGGRGIKVCDEWLNDFYSFKKWALENGYEESLSIDRIDVNGNYEPSNCKWSTDKEQANNRRNNTIIEYNGEKRTLAEWSEIYNITPSNISKRIKLGWNLDKVFNTSIRCVHSKIQIVETGEIFNTLEECAKAISGYPSNIGRCLNGQRKTYKGLHFMELPKFESEG